LGQAYQVHPSENIFLLRDDDAVAYEVDILRGIQPRLRVQVISIQNALFTTASDADGAKRLTDATNASLKDRAITIQKRDYPGPNQFRVAILALNGTSRFEQLEWRSKPPPVWVDWFSEGIEVSPDPRMSVDAFGRMRFRVRKLRDVTKLLDRMFNEPMASWLIPLSQVTRSRFSGRLRRAAAIADGQRQDQRWVRVSALSSITQRPSKYSPSPSWQSPGTTG
jgi:hypothetical protein